MTTRAEHEPTANGTETQTTVWQYFETWPHKGLLSSIEYPGQTIYYNYDTHQRINRETVTFDGESPYETRYGYDEASRLAWVHYPSGFAHYYDYNTIGHLYRLSHNYGYSETYRLEQTTPWGQVERYSLDRDIFVNLEYHPEKHKLTHILTTQGENILQNLRYDYDGFSNLASRKDEERDLEEHFTYDHLNRLTKVWRDGIMRSWMEYDAYGRMTKKVADNRPLFSQAVFHPDKPHAMASASTYYGLFPDGEQNITYTSFDKVKRIVQDGNTIEYAYGYDRQRIFMEEHVGSTTRTKRYLGNCELLTVTTDEDTVSTQWLTYLAGPTGVYAVVTTDTEGTHTIHYVLKDNLGSWATITDRHGNIEQELSYDPWGTRRNPDTWHTHNNQNLEAPMFDRGYTGHEHLYAFGLINMNGRMYDPLTSSFLSVDAYVQSPDNAQSFNRYAYCQNNPLRYVDPSGWYMQGASYGTPITGSSWGESYSQHAYEPRELGMLQLPENKVMTWWMEGSNLNVEGHGGGGIPTSGGFYDEKGNYLGSDGKNDGKVYVIRSEIIEVMNKKNAIVSFLLNEESSFSWNDIYQCFVEIVPSRFMRNMMYTIVSKDDGKGGTKESNNREYGGFINEFGMVIEVDAGVPKRPGEDDKVTISFPHGSLYATFHSHPSGNGQSYFKDDNEYELVTPIFQQSPTPQDLKISGNHICYVFGRRDGFVYVYNRNGVQAIINTSTFISTTKFIRP